MTRGHHRGLYNFYNVGCHAAPLKTFVAGPAWDPLRLLLALREKVLARQLGGLVLQHSEIASPDGLTQFQADAGFGRLFAALQCTERAVNDQPKKLQAVSCCLTNGSRSTGHVRRL